MKGSSHPNSRALSLDINSCKNESSFRKLSSKDGSTNPFWHQKKPYLLDSSVCTILNIHIFKFGAIVAGGITLEFNLQNVILYILSESCSSILRLF